MSSSDSYNDERTPLMGSSAVSRVKKLSRLSLIAIMYFSVAGGPEGTETMVKTAGPLVTFLGIIVLGVVFAVPLALMTTELSTMYPENGGFVLWAKAAFGSGAGGMAGWLQFSFSAVDTALYPGLFVTYLARTMQTMYSPEASGWLQAAFIVIITALNLGGIDSVGHGSTVMMLFLLLPFGLIVLIAFSGVFTGTTVTGWTFETANMWQTLPETDWAKFTLVLIWNMGMWETASVCSGEVDDVAKDFPPALAITVFLVVLNYVLPIAAFVGLDGDYSAYNNGHYIDIMQKVGGVGWATWLGLSQCVSAAGLFTNGIVKNAFMLCGMGEQGMLPTALAWRMPLTKAPVVSIAVTQAVTIAMVFFGDFQAVLGVDMLLYCLNLLLEIASLIHLRNLEPDTPRPYRIPADGVLLWLVFLPSIILSIYVVVTSGVVELLVAAVLIGIGAVTIYLVSLAQQQAPTIFAGVDTVMHVEHHTGGIRPD
eukprot:CAMPEP_0206245394 /NCGR_PEP_ID=MMETSP0047_2-20121206/18673_1 /ASSEMBLY_ACC=CAM_ASM_000192 /TAXON_ID=195065 /ORGANISM="Chroomonas mesostigmatica_cf, Strain CCMP1168" /LENGTH=480 /DNA_ID=CAMNT_0053670689 /DNA_START=86 /DNA_END=1529 /DNA_ORIENTATION=-